MTPGRRDDVRPVGTGPRARWPSHTGGVRPVGTGPRARWPSHTGGVPPAGAGPRARWRRTTGLVGYPPAAVGASRPARTMVGGIDGNTCTHLLLSPAHTP